MSWFLVEKKYLIISIIICFLDGIIIYFYPSYFNRISFFYPMLTISLIPFLFHDNLKNYYRLIFLIGFIYDLLYATIFLYNALIFLILAKVDLKILNYFKDNALIYLILIILNITVYDTISFILVLLTNYQSLLISDLLYKISHSLLLNILSGFVYYFLFKKKFFYIKLIGDKMKYKCLQKFNKDDRKNHKIIKFINKTLMAVFLGLVFLIVMEYSPKFKDFMHNEVLDKNISFGYLGKLYNKFFGEVLPSTNDNVVQVFKEKITYQEKEAYQNGYKLTVANNYLVPVMESGVVVFIGEKDDLGNVIVIEGEDGSTITYGNIKNTDIKLYEYVTNGKFLGEANGNYLYLIILKGGEYLDIETYLS